PIRYTASRTPEAAAQLRCRATVAARTLHQDGRSSAIASIAAWCAPVLAVRANRSDGLEAPCAVEASGPWLPFPPHTCSSHWLTPRIPGVGRNNEWPLAPNPRLQGHTLETAHRSAAVHFGKFPLGKGGCELAVSSFSFCPNPFPTTFTPVPAPMPRAEPE